MADLGYIALLLALLASLYYPVAYIWGQRGRYSALLASAEAGLFIACGLVSISVIILLFSLLTHNFQIEYVASYTSRDMPVQYLFSALWAGNDGSLLFWAWLLSIFAMILVLQGRKKHRQLVAWASVITMLTEAFFLILLLAVSNPFRELPTIPADGMGLNPMLENAGMIFHPPALLAGYVGFTIPFALAIAALITRKLDNEWLLPARRWALISWLLLGAGNAIGAWWAYVELGWGGYWAWDPVENAGLMPWLVATAFLHSSIMQKRQGVLKIWSMFLIIITFNLAIFGTFLTRSGVLSSVHTFGEFRLGPFFLVFMTISILVPLGLLYNRSNDLKSNVEIGSLLSREGTIQLNNLLLLGATLVVFAGTIFPAISEFVYGTKITVGEGFFNLVDGPVFLTIAVLVGICTVIGWRRASGKRLLADLLMPFIGTIVVLVVLLILGMREWVALVAFSLCGFVLFSILYGWSREIRERQQLKAENYIKTFWFLIKSNKPRYGGYIVHIAIVLIAIGVIGSSVYDVERETALKIGDSVTVKNYVLTYDDLAYRETESKSIVTGTFSVYNGDKLLGRMTPEKYFHRSYEQPVTEAAIRSTLIEDLYIILDDWDNEGTAYFTVMVNPLVDWIWIGGVILVLGGLLALWPSRRLIEPKQASVSSISKREIEKGIEKEILEVRRGKVHSSSTRKMRKTHK